MTSELQKLELAFRGLSDEDEDENGDVVIGDDELTDDEGLDLDEEEDSFVE